MDTKRHSTATFDTLRNFNRICLDKSIGSEAVDNIKLLLYSWRHLASPSSFEAVDFVFFLLPRHSPSKLGPCSCFVRQLFIATDHYINVFKHVYRTVMISVTYRNPYRLARKRYCMTRPNDTDDTLIQYLLPFC